MFRHIVIATLSNKQTEQKCKNESCILISYNLLTTIIEKFNKQIIIAIIL